MPDYFAPKDVWGSVRSFRRPRRARAAPEEDDAVAPTRRVQTEDNRISRRGDEDDPTLEHLGSSTRAIFPRRPSFPASDASGSSSNETISPTPNPIKARTVANVKDEDVPGPKVTILPGYSTEMRHNGLNSSLRDVRQIDECSTVVFPSARGFVQEAIPVDDNDMEAHFRSGPIHPSRISPGFPERNGGGTSVPPRMSPSPFRGGGVPWVGKDPAPDLELPERRSTCGSQIWASFSQACTFPVTDRFIHRDGKAAKQAWREKVATCLIAFLVSVVLVGGFGFVPLLLCQEREFFAWGDIWAQNRGMLNMHRKSW